MTQPLTGKDLLGMVQELSKAASPSRRELARLCGYAKTTKKGEARVDVTGFYQALLEAKGIKLNSDTFSKRGREATSRVKVQKNGQIVLGSSYTRSMGLQPGDTFDIKLGYKHIHLVQRGGESAEAE